MTIQEIFDQKAIKELEYEILDIESKDRKLQKCSSAYPHKIEIIKPLLNVRKKLLDEAFVPTDSNKKLMSTFSAVIRQKQEEIRHSEEAALSVAANSHPKGDMRAYSFWYFSSRYPESHPVQTIRAKKIWSVLNGPCGYSDSFSGGLDSGHGDLMMYFNNENNMQTEAGFMQFHEAEYHEEICEVAVCPIVNNLYKNSIFSLFDMIWVRAFEVHIHVCDDYANYVRDIDETDIPGWIDF